MCLQGCETITRLEQVGVDVRGEEGRLVLRATGSDVEFPGFLAAFGTGEAADESGEDAAQEGKDESPNAQEARAKASVLARLQVGAM